VNKLAGCALMPHPPIMVPEVGRGELAKIASTVTAAEQAAGALMEKNPQTVVIITPHGPVFRDAVSISVHPRLRGTLAAFGAPDVALGFETDGLLARMIIRQAQRLGINLVELTDDLAKTYRFSLELDHGALVPLYYLHKANFRGQIVHLTIGMLPYEEMYTFGKAVQLAIGMADKRVAVIASGDLSHRLRPEAPAGYSPRGAEFDREVMRAVGEMDTKSLLNLPPDLIRDAGECGLRPIIFLMGVLGGLDAEARVLSYEGPFGVGYGIALFTIKQDDGQERDKADKSGKFDAKEGKAGEAEAAKEVEAAREAHTAQAEESLPVRWAKASLRFYLENHRQMPAPAEVPKEFLGRAGAFVSLKKRGGLRGCIGTFAPTKANIAEEIIANAVKAGTEDPRFPPVTLNELPELDFSVDVLSPPERVNDVKELDPKKYGIIVRAGYRSGLLLPDLEGVDSVEEQISIAMRKAGIMPGEPVELYRFSVTRYK